MGGNQKLFPCEDNRGSRRISYNAIHQEEKFCIVVMQEEELVTDVELVNRIIKEKYRGFIKDFFFSKINEEYVMLLSGIECMDNELIVQ